MGAAHVAAMQWRCCQGSQCFSWLGRSLCGDDAFYRDAEPVFQPLIKSENSSFYDCNEGDESHVECFLLARAQEQLLLKHKKTAVLASFTRFACWRRATGALESLSARTDGIASTDLARTQKLPPC